MTPFSFATPAQFAQMTGMSLSTIRRRLRDRDLPAIQVGGPGTAWLIDVVAFQALSVMSVPEAQASLSGDIHASVATPREDKSAKRLAGPKPKWLTKLQNKSS